MLSESVLIALNAQMGHEMHNSYIYKSFSGIADYQGLIGTCSWFEKQSQEEYKHFDKFYKYISDQGSIPHLTAIPEIPPQIFTIQEMFTQAVALEKQTTDNLKKVAEVCKEMNDDQTYELILWYLKEQIEEEKTIGDILKRVLMSMNNILILDNELGQR